MESRFHRKVNRTVEDENGNLYVQVQHRGKLHRVDFANTDAELEAVKTYDNRYYIGPQSISMNDLREIRNNGKVLMVLDADRDTVLGVSQILLSSIDRQEVRMHEAFNYGTVGRGVGQILYKAQEVVAREARKHSMRLTVRLTNTEAIRAQFKAGFRITEFDPTRYGSMEAGGARLVMSKNLINEQFPFAPDKQSALVTAGKVKIINRCNELQQAIADHPGNIGVRFKVEDQIAIDTQMLVKDLVYSSYFGIGLLQSHEFGESDSEFQLLVFQRRDLPPRADRLKLPVTVKNEFSKLNEVIISYTPENAQIREEYAINDVARMNVDNIDPIAFKDEYNLFVGTLIDQGVNVVHTNSIGKEGKSAIFTRDPAFVLGEQFVMGELAQQQRRYETDGMRLISSESPSVELTGEEGAYVEGGDVIFIDDQRVVVGIGQRTTMAGFKKMQLNFPDYEFIAVPHKDLHLDVLFTMLGEKHCLLDVTQLPEEFVQMLKDDGYTLVIADPEEQVALGCNVVCLDNNRVIAVKENAVTNQRLRDSGVEVVEVSMPNVVKWGGGPRCMTCPTNRGAH